MIRDIPASMTGTLVFKRARIHRKNITVYWQTLGLWGFLATLANLVFGYPEYLAITAEGVKHPLFIRLGTSDVEVYRDTFLKQEYDYPTIFSPRTIVDVGANCGMTSVFYANRYPAATVVAVEPEASNYAALVRNTRSYPNITPVHGALWSADGQVEVFPPWPRWKQWGKWGFRIRKGKGCRAFTLTTLMREAGMETVDILKIDVEGAEREIFSSCDWMDKVRLLAIELHDRETPGCSDAVNAVASQHQRTERGMVTFYLR
jgi:FkbM family methyltransferase